MASLLAGVDLKIGRAKAHLANLKQGIETVLDPNAYRFDTKYDSETKRYVYTVHHLPAVNPEWSIHVGEALYQYRSALDHLAWQLVELCGVTPNEQTQFPIRDSLLDKNGKLMSLQVLMPQIKDRKILGLLNQCQPYYGGGTADKAHRSGLWHLKVLNNVDKHRLLLVVVCVLNIDMMYWGMPRGVKSPAPYLNAAPLKEGSPVAWFDFHGAEPPANFDPHPSLKVVMREPEAPLLSHVEVVGAMEGIGQWVEWEVVSRFRPLFP
jgi:hypothetical protein